MRHLHSVRSNILTALLFAFCLNVFAQESVPMGEYVATEYVVDSDTLLYRIMYPNDFDESKSYPLVVFLHGAGERGNNNTSQLAHGSKLFMDSLDKYPAVVIFPQCPRESYWSNVDVDRSGNRPRFQFKDGGEPTIPLTLVMDLMDKTIAEPYIDNDRVYLSGLSMGGMGAWELLWRIPEKLAAAMPICGGGSPKMAQKMIDVPIWAFHGKLDDIVPPHYSVSMIRAVQEEGGKAKVTIYPNANHNSWDPTFAEPDYLKWMFSNKRMK